MITLIPYTTLGHVDHGWLNARHHFSFASYYDQNRMGFGLIRVINDDIIQAGKGFDTHPHENMEIITYVRQGAITHKDSKGNEGRTEAGDVQVMSAGTGIRHSEYNLENEDTSIYQIWIYPRHNGGQPDWDSYTFPKEYARDELALLVSGDGKAPLSIKQDAEIYAGRLAPGTKLEHPIKRQAYLLVSDGEVEVSGQLAKKGDGVEITHESTVTLHAHTQAEVLLIDVPAE